MPKKSFYVGLAAGVAVVVLGCFVAREVRESAPSRSAASQPPTVVSRSGAPTAKQRKTRPSPDPQLQTTAPHELKALLDTKPPPIPSQQIADRFPLSTLPDDALDFAFDDTTQRLAVAGSFGSSLGVFETGSFRLGAEVEPRLIDLEGPVTAVIVKQFGQDRVFVAAAAKPARLFLVDTTTLEVTKSIELDTSAPQWLAGSLNGDDPYVVYACWPNLTRPRSFDLNTAEGEYRFDSDIVDVKFSIDGKALFYQSTSIKDGRGLYTLRRSSRQPPSADLPRIGYQRRAGSARLDPRGWFIATGNQLLSIDLKTRIGVAEFNPQAFFADAPWMAGWDSHRFCIGSINDARTVEKVELPSEWVGTPRLIVGNLQHVWPVIADEDNEQFLACTRRHIVAFQLASFDLPRESVLWSTAKFPATATIGESLSIPLTFAQEPDSVQLETHPSGIVVDGSTLRWTPQETDFGEHTITVLAQSGRVRRPQSWTIEVRRKRLDAPFRISGFSVADDGKRAAIWGDPIARQGQKLEFQRLAVLDLSTREVILSKHMEKPLSAAKLIGDDLYVLSSDNLLRLSPESLEPQEEPNSSANHTLTVVGIGRPKRFDLNSLDEIEDYAHAINSSEYWLAGRSGFGPIAEGVLWDEVTEQPKLLLWPYEFRRAPWERFQLASPHSLKQVRLTSHTWHPCDYNDATRRRTSKKMLAAALSPDLPATLAVTRHDDRHYLSAFDLRRGNEFAAIPLATAEEEFQNVSSLVAIETTPEIYFVLLHNQIYTGSLADLKNGVSPPFHIKPQQSVLLLLLDKPTKVRYEAEGAIRFHLDSRDLGEDREWFHAVSESGEFTLSAEAALHNLGKGHVEFRNRRPAVNSSRYIEPARLAFRRMLGRDPKGVPIPLRVFVTAEGENFDRATLAHDFLVDVPRVLIDRAIGEDPLNRSQ